MLYLLLEVLCVIEFIYVWWSYLLFRYFTKRPCIHLLALRKSINCINWKYFRTEFLFIFGKFLLCYLHEIIKNMFINQYYINRPWNIYNQDRCLSVVYTYMYTFSTRFNAIIMLSLLCLNLLVNWFDSIIIAYSGSISPVTQTIRQFNGRHGVIDL